MEVTIGTRKAYQYWNDWPILPSSRSLDAKPFLDTQMIETRCQNVHQPIHVTPAAGFVVR